MTSGITVVIPTIPPREDLLLRARGSLTTQTLQPDEVIVELDTEGVGAALTRHRGLMKVTTEWVAFLDDDDWFKPEHLATLKACADETGADYVFSYYEIYTHLGQCMGEIDWVLTHFGKEFNPADPHQTTITTLVRTELAQSVGFAPPEGGDEIDGQRAGEDWLFTLGCVERGAKIVHTPHRTWYWAHNGRNTSGRPWNRPETWT